jgi:Alpha 1,4-glycosyltransferase conserved region
VNGAVLYAESGDEVIARCLEEALAHQAELSWGDIGPKLLTRIVRQLGNFDQVHPPAACYPVHWRDALDVLRPEAAAHIRERVRSSWFLHLWNEILRQERINKYLLPAPGSFLRMLADRHPVKVWRELVTA